jgi:membrane peptidoglycan carboxypeptidase
MPLVITLPESNWKRVGLGAGALFVFFVLFCGVAYALTDVPTPNRIATDQATKVTYSDGHELGRIGKNRVIVPLSAVSEPAQHAVLSAEDRDFYSEPGISVKGIGRALFSNVKAGGVSQGGSTITQQYAKNAFLTQERTVSRKVKEVFIAVKMSRTVSKDKVLENYLNTIYFGRGAYGIEAASETYFHKHAKDLNASEAAVIAASIRSPAGYDPKRHPQKSKDRWSYVLDGMVKKGWLAQSERDAAVYPDVQGPPTSSRSFPGELSYIEQKIEAELAARGFDEARLGAGGLVVKTTLSFKAQDKARKAMDELIPKQKAKDDPVAALVAVEPHTGKVVAYYGGRDPGGFDWASDGKGVQPGSSMKPYTLAAALEKGTSLNTTYDGHSPQEICGTQIHNDEGDPPLGQTDLARGLELSVNTVYYRLACDTGAERIAALAHAAGIPGSQPLADPTSHKPTAQITLGSGGYEIHPIDQATGYATFAAQGERANPYFVQKVTDSDNNVLYSAKVKTSRAFTEDVAADATYAMQRVVQNGTGTRAALAGRPTAGKTGTTGNNANAWFAGFTPQLAAAVWVGRPSGAPLKGVLGSTGGVYGGTVPAKIFKAFMDGALENEPVKQFPQRANVGSKDGTSVSPVPTGSATPSPTATVTVPPVTLPPVIQTESPTPEPTQSATPEPTATQTATPPPASSAPPATGAPPNNGGGSGGGSTG